MPESTNASVPETVSLAFQQVPLMLRSFLRQRALVLWTYGFSVVALFVGCSVLAGGGEGSAELRPLLGCAVVLLTALCAGVYGASRGIWDFFGGAAIDRYARCPNGGSAILAFCLARFLVLLSAAVLQLLLLAVVYKIPVWRSPIAILLVVILSAACYVGTGLLCATVVRSRRQTLVLSNFVFAVMLVFSGAMIPTDLLPAWTMGISRALPSWHTMQALQKIIIEFAPLKDVLTSVGVLAVAAAIVFGLSAWRFSWLALDEGAGSILEG